MEQAPNTVILQCSDYEQMLDAARNALPEEACGLVAGQREGNVLTVRRVYVLENTDHSAEHFSLDPQEQLAAIRDMRQNGLIPLGNWHSHPQTPSRPSEEDKRLAFDRNAVYFILSLAEETPVLNAFHIEGGESRRENLKITE